MSTIQTLSEEIERGLSELCPSLSKPLRRKLPLAIAAMLEVQSPNTVELSNALPLNLDRQDMREQWLRRLLASPALNCEVVMEPLARDVLRQATAHGETLLLSLDQTDLGNRMAILMLAVRIGERALPLLWTAEAGAANLGFEKQKLLLERILTWIPEGTRVLLLADRFYPSSDLFHWLQEHHWSYRLRLKGNLLADPGFGDEKLTGELLEPGMTERYLPNVRLFGKTPVMTAIGILQEAGHAEPWIIAMDASPTKATVLDYASRWAIEPMFSDFKSRGFELEDSQLKQPDRLERMVLIMAIAMHWCVHIGQDQAIAQPTPLEKKHKNKVNRPIGALKNSIGAESHGSLADCVI
jgi:hypothetical protein